MKLVHIGAMFRCAPVLFTNIEAVQGNSISLNQTFENSSKRIEDYNKSLETLLDETKKTYREVNHSLRVNAEYIKDELK